MPKVTTLDQKEQFIELRAKGVPYEQIAKEIGVSKPTLINWAKECEREIGNRRQFELEVLQEKYHVSKKKRIEFYGQQLERLLEELKTRDLGEISTDKLFEMTMKTMNILKQEEAPINFMVEEDELEKQLESFGKSYTKVIG